MGSSVEVSLLTILWVEGTNAGPFGLCILGRPGVALGICIKDQEVAPGNLYARPEFGLWQLIS